jgi:hypothetical protein
MECQGRQAKATPRRALSRILCHDYGAAESESSELSGFDRVAKVDCACGLLLRNRPLASQGRAIRVRQATATLVRFDSSEHRGRSWETSPR